MAGKSVNSIGAKNWSPNSPATRYNASGKNREFYTFENAPGLGNYATGGTIIDGNDGYIYHIFTGDGTFAVNRPPAAIDSVDYLIVAGGGGASATFEHPGGGGGGGMLFGNALIGPGPYPISVGAGGPSSPNVTSSTRNGTPSSAFAVTASGGGGGGQPGTPAPQRPGSPGGSGGGGGATPGSPPALTSSGSAIDTVPRQGYPAGTPQPPSGLNRGGTGGGGAGGLGAQGTGPPPLGGAGGPGRIAPEFPSTIVRQAIPAPVLPSWDPLVGPGGYSRGGNGFPFPTSQNSPNNSGYGGSDLAGGSGIVCIRYKKTAAYSRATGGTIEPNTHPEHPGVFRHIFTSPGTFEVTDPTLQWIDYLAVGGGGGGGGTAPGTVAVGGGGGAGGFVSSIHTSTTTPTAIPEAYPWNPGYSVEVGEQYPVGVGTYPVSIGTGGSGGTGGGASAGGNTTIGSPGPVQIIAAGGGLGGTAPGAGGAGGSGGGGAKFALSTTPMAGGTATPTPLIQGNPGGTTPATSPSSVGSGGGGAGASGGATTGGGNGWYSVLSPSAYGTPGPLTPTTIYRYFAGGGGGALSPPGLGTNSGGAGGGGAGLISATPGAGTPGTTNTGGGGGGSFSNTGANGGTGGPGIVIIQYPE